MNNLEEDLKNSDWFCEKVRNSDTYAQNLYAALCNRSWQKLDVIDILTDQDWSCTWRYAGGLVADIQGHGDYMNWYCSGMGSGLGNGDTDGSKGYVGESHITDEIEEDLKTLGWIPCEDYSDESF